LDEEFNAELKVTQPEAKSDLDARREALEKKLNKHLELENKDDNSSGPAEIRTQDLKCKSNVVSITRQNNGEIHF
jgi:hypothetical protein